MPTEMLREILEEMTNCQQDMEVVGHAADEELRDAVEKYNANVLICELPSGLPPTPFNELFEDFEDLIIVGLTDEGSRAAVYVPDLGIRELLSIIRSAVLASDSPEESVPWAKKGKRIFEFVLDKTGFHQKEEGVELSAIPKKVAKVGEKPYKGNWEYVEDELRRLDLLLQIQFEGCSANPSVKGLDGLQGLVITPAEVSALLGKSSNPEERQGDQKFAHEVDQISMKIAARKTASDDSGIPLALPHLSMRFGLSPFEEMCLLICLAPEWNRKYERIFAFLQDDMTRKKPSVDLVLSLLCKGIHDRMPALACFGPNAPLLKYRILQFSESPADEPTLLLSRSLKLDDRILSYVMDFNEVDPQIGAFTRLIPISDSSETKDVLKPIREQAYQLSKAFLAQNDGEHGFLLYIHGAYGSGKKNLAELVCQQLQVPLVMTDMRKLLSQPLAYEEILPALFREAMLQPAVVCFEHVDCFFKEDDRSRQQWNTLVHWIETVPQLTILLSQEPWRLEDRFRKQYLLKVALPVPDAMSRKRFWAELIGDEISSIQDEDLEALANKFHFTPGQIRDAVDTAKAESQWGSKTEEEVTVEQVYSACRAQSNPKLEALAKKLNPISTWDDLVLPEDQMEQLRELRSHVKHKQLVMEKWGFSKKSTRGAGLTTLFAGSSGTGKTMAAEVIANVLGLDLYKIDLSGVVSKYIGETEKNLNKIFTEAKESNAILFFDEADALFGKRSEVKDAHDRYANIEVAYLLQKMEEYDGIVILATNLRKNMDDAFVRRMKFIVEFPFPNEKQRQKIWRKIFPARAPIGPDVDFRFLSKKLQITGGNIKNISLTAAYLAAEEPDGIISMKSLILASKREFQKMGRSYSDAEFGHYGRSYLSSFQAM